MENNIFTLQCQFINKYDKIYQENYYGKKKAERLNFFKALNNEISHFFYIYSYD